MSLDSADLLDLIRPKLQRLAEKGVTDLEDVDQQDLVKLIAKKYLEHLENPLPTRVPMAATPAPTGSPQTTQVDHSRDMCAPPGFQDPMKAGSVPTKRGGKMPMPERIQRARQAAREASEESHSFDGEYADEAIGSPMGAPPRPPQDHIQIDPHTGQPVIPVRQPLQLPPE
jgi:hypothetical protein